MKIDFYPGIFFYEFDKNSSVFILLEMFCLPLNDIDLNYCIKKITDVS